MAGEAGPARHALVFVRPERRADVRTLDPSHAPDAARWLALGRPAVARRRDAAVAADEVALAIALPLARGRARVALAAPADAVARVAPPLALGEALAAAPATWRGPLAALDAEAGAAGLVLRVYGSVAWERLTGEAYLRPESDVDLLVPGSTGGERARALALLARWAAHAEPRLDGELDLGAGRAVAWREVLASPARVLVKSSSSVSLERLPLALAEPGGEGRGIARTIDDAALAALHEELAADPKPGLVSPSSRGAHADMDAGTFAASLGVLRGAFADAADAGARAAPFGALRAIGLEAEARMLRATGGANTHRGAIFSLGLLAAAAGRVAAGGGPWTRDALSRTVRVAFGEDVRALAPAPGSHGAAARRAHGVAAAREEAAAGFPHVFEVALPALDASVRRGAALAEAAVQALFALVERLPDTNLLHRGGAEGLAFARASASEFLRAGGVHRRGWRAHAREIDRAFVRRRLSPGGSADLLAAALFVERLRATPGGPLSLALSPAVGGGGEGSDAGDA